MPRLLCWGKPIARKACMDMALALEGLGFLQQNSENPILGRVSTSRFNRFHRSRQPHRQEDNRRSNRRETSYGEPTSNMTKWARPSCLTTAANVIILSGWTRPFIGVFTVQFTITSCSSAGVSRSIRTGWRGGVPAARWPVRRPGLAVPTPRGTL